MVYIGSDTSEFFDSLGNHLSKYKYNFESALAVNSSNYVMNTQRLQSMGSNLCRLYYLLYIFLRELSYSFNDIIMLFSNDTQDNDYFISSRLVK